jgi:hypothetical protein
VQLHLSKHIWVTSFYFGVQFPGKFQQLIGVGDAGFLSFRIQSPHLPGSQQGVVAAEAVEWITRLPIHLVGNRLLARRFCGQRPEDENGEQQ